MELTLAELVRQAFAKLGREQREGLSVAQRGSLEPHMAGNSLALEPELAWQATLEVLPGAQRGQLKVPAGWPEWVESLPATGWLVHALGEFPQRLDMDAVLQGEPTDLAGSTAEPLPARAGQGVLTKLLGIALLRQAGDWDQAAKQLELLAADHGTEEIRRNEQAALAWAGGDVALAAKLWSTCAETAGVLYNRGLARRALGDAEGARALFNRAADLWPETSAWHHLARVCALVG